MFVAFYRYEDNVFPVTLRWRYIDVCSIGIPIILLKKVKAPLRQNHGLLSPDLLICTHPF